MDTDLNEVLGEIEMAKEKIIELYIPAAFWSPLFGVRLGRVEGLEQAAKIVLSVMQRRKNVLEPIL